MSVKHNIVTEFADIFECACGYRYEGPNRSDIEIAHLYVNHFVDDSPSDALADNPYQHLSREDLIAILLATRGNRESESFFAHLNRGEVKVKAFKSPEVIYLMGDPIETLEWRLVIESEVEE